MKRIIMFFLFISGFHTVFSQTLLIELGGSSLGFSKDTMAELKSFSAKYNSGNVYLKWVVSNDENDGLYVIFRSYDNEHFDVVGYKKSVGTNSINSIAYFFTDESVVQKETYYKILHIGEAPSYFFSSAISVLNMAQESCQTAK